MITNYKTKSKPSILVISQGILFEHDLPITKTGCVYFFNAQHKYLKLKPIQRAYFDYICEHMVERNNNIKLKPSLRGDFIAFCDKIMSKKDYCSEKTLQRAEEKFKELYLIFDVEGSPFSVVNPRHVFKGSHAKRESCYFKLAKLAREGKIPVAALLDTPLSELKPSPKLMDIYNELIDIHPEKHQTDDL